MPDTLYQEKIPARTGQISEPEQLAMEISAQDGRAQMEFIQANISQWLKSPEYEMMQLGQRYFENENDILQRRRKVIGRNGEMIDAPYLANNTLSHPFMRKLVKQKIGYLLSKQFTVTSDDKAFQEKLGRYIDKNFYRVFKNAGQEGIIRGKGWLQVYYDQNGDLRFKRIPATEVIPFWADIDHTQLDGAIRIYDVEVYQGGQSALVQHVKYFTPEAVYNYVRQDGGLVPDPETPVEYSFAIATDKETAAEENIMWNKIPLIPLKYNGEEDSLLKYIKQLIDDYDKGTSDLSNVIEDEPDKIKVVKNYDGTDKGEFVYNLAKYRTVFLRDNGSVESLDTSVSVEAVEARLARTRRDIYEAAGGVDTQNTDTGEKSGTALKFLYADLDMDCADFAAELAWAMEECCWFIKQDLLLKGLGNHTQASVDTTFNTDITINEKETIENIKNSVGIISNATLIKNHPYVDDAAEEEKLLQEEAGGTRGQQGDRENTEDTEDTERTGFAGEIKSTAAQSGEQHTDTIQNGVTE